MTHTHIHTCINTYIHTYIHTHTHLHTHIYIHTTTFIHTTHIYIHTHTVRQVQGPEAQQPVLHRLREVLPRLQSGHVGEWAPTGAGAWCIYTCIHVYIYIYMYTFDLREACSITYHLSLILSVPCHFAFALAHTNNDLSMTHMSPPLHICAPAIYATHVHPLTMTFLWHTHIHTCTHTYIHTLTYTHPLLMQMRIKNHGPAFWFEKMDNFVKQRKDLGVVLV